MTPYHQFVAEHVRLLTSGKQFPLGGFAPLPRPALAAEAPRVLIFSPHPDDEVIIGGLALRLLREAGMRVLNVAVTQGSNQARQAGRLAELRACCDHIGFELITTREGGLENVNARTREQRPDLWQTNVTRIAEILAEQQPRVILFPHLTDRNSSHIGTHHLVLDALATMPADFTTYAVETEFWGAMDTPNLMVETSAQDLGDLLAALSFHVGEVQRNPYHLRTPGWMIDNVRRGGELVGAQGGAAPDFAFATLYRLRRWQVGRLQTVLERGQFVSQSDNIGALFPAG